MAVPSFKAARLQGFYWVAVKELKLSYHTFRYHNIYYIHIMAIEVKFLNSNPVNQSLRRLTSSPC